MKTPVQQATVAYYAYIEAPTLNTAIMWAAAASNAYGETGGDSPSARMAVRKEVAKLPAHPLL